MNIQLKNSAHHFHMLSEREQTLVPAGSRSIVCVVVFSFDTKSCIH